MWYLKILYLSVLIFSIFSISWNEGVGILFILISFLLIKWFVNLQSHSIQTKAFLVKGYKQFHSQTPVFAVNNFDTELWPHRKMASIPYKAKNSISQSF